jgi:branched-subunit amino acid aminotransferase/4-amino-4-deoxychorismate lyase
LHLTTIDCGNIRLSTRTVKRSADYAILLRIVQQQRCRLTTSQSALLCADEKIISTMTANILLYVAGRWITPNSDGILTGIIRQALLAEKLIHAETCSCSLLRKCVAMACINSGTFMQPVASVNNRPLDTSPPLFQCFYDFFHDQSGTPTWL